MFELIVALLWYFSIIAQGMREGWRYLKLPRWNFPQWNSYPKIKRDNFRRTGVLYQSRRHRSLPLNALPPAAAIASI
jgi:hypothetical protein